MTAVCIQKIVFNNITSCAGKQDNCTVGYNVIAHQNRIIKLSTWVNYIGIFNI